jgi:hypothetical protein
MESLAQARLAAKAQATLTTRNSIEDVFIVGNFGFWPLADKAQCVPHVGFVPLDPGCVKKALLAVIRAIRFPAILRGI